MTLVYCDTDVFVDAALAPHFHYLFFCKYWNGARDQLRCLYRLNGDLSTDPNYLDVNNQTQEQNISTYSLEGTQFHNYLLQMHDIYISATPIIH